MKIRPAVQNDLPSIVAIYNQAIQSSVATFDTSTYTVEDRADWFAQFGDEHPLLVCQSEEGSVAGFAYFLPYRPKPGYSRTKETTIYVDPAWHRKGVAASLYEELIQCAKSNGVHALIAVLGGKNAPSERLHEKFGFRLVGHYPEVGFKFEMWVDTYTYIKIL